MGYYARREVLIGSVVFIPGDFILDEEVTNDRAKRLIDAGLICREEDVWQYVNTPVIETAEAPPEKEETEVKKTKKKPSRRKSAE